jgi:trigger factor
MLIAETLNEGLKREFSVTIPADELLRRIDERAASVAAQMRMPGFRPGKIPLNLVRKMHGQALRQEALNAAVQEGVQKLVADKGLRPAVQPEVRLADGSEEGGEVTFNVALEVLPVIEEPRTEGLKLERLVVEPTEAEVDEALARIASQQKRFDAAPASHAAEAGDVVVVDFEGKVGGEPFEGGKGEGMSVEIGSGRFIPGFEEQLAGATANEQRVLKVTFPDDYGVDYLKGREAEFEVTVTEVRRPATPEIDDEFAKSLGLEDLDKLKEILREQLKNELDGMSRTQMKRQLLDRLAETHDFEVPPSMVEAEFRQIWGQLQQEAGRETDPEAARAELESERDDYRRIAERRVRLGLLLADIGQRNRVEVSQAEMNRLVAQEVSRYPREQQQRAVQFFQQNPMAAAQLRAPLFEDKVVDLLISQAEVTERTVNRGELEEAIQAAEEDLSGVIGASETGDFEAHVHGPHCDHDHDHHGHDHHGHDHHGHDHHGHDHHHHDHAHGDHAHDDDGHDHHAEPGDPGAAEAASSESGSDAAAQSDGSDEAEGAAKPRKGKRPTKEAAGAA